MPTMLLTGSRDAVSSASEPNQIPPAAIAMPLPALGRPISKTQ